MLISSVESLNLRLGGEAKNTLCFSKASWHAIESKVLCREAALRVYNAVFRRKC